MRKRVVWLVVTGLMISGPVARATSEKQTLKGIKHLQVVIEGLEEPERQAGLTESSLRVLVELRLRKAGITVLDYRALGDPWLYLSVGCVPRKHGSEIVSFTYSNSLELNQDAVLKRNSLFVTATTWAVHRYGYCGSQRTGAIEESVAKMVDEFINEFLAVNPVKPH